MGGIAFMEKAKKDELVRIIKFVCFSASAGVIQIVSDIFFNEVCAFKPWLSYLLSLVLSVLWNFTFNRKFTFHSASNVPVAMLKVALFYLVFTPLSTLWTDVLVGKAAWNEYLVLALTMLINFVSEFFYQKFVVFADARKAEMSENDSSVDGKTVNNTDEKIQE